MQLRLYHHHLSLSSLPTALALNQTHYRRYVKVSLYVHPCLSLPTLQQHAFNMRSTCHPVFWIKYLLLPLCSHEYHWFMILDSFLFSCFHCWWVSMVCLVARCRCSYPCMLAVNIWGIWTLQQCSLSWALFHSFDCFSLPQLGRLILIRYLLGTYQVLAKYL
jgi:hypothetical protein